LHPDKLSPHLTFSATSYGDHLALTYFIWTTTMLPEHFKRSWIFRNWDKDNCQV